MKNFIITAADLVLLVAIKKIIEINRRVTIIILILICFLQLAQGFTNINDPHYGESVGNTIDWYYLSPLNVIETITDIGGGSYLYEFSFMNVDTSPIWSFGVYTTFDVQNVTTFAKHSSWGVSSLEITSVLPEYDARNLDADIIRDTHTWTKPWEDPITSIQISESASEFSFTASLYDPSPKYYQYETLASGYTQTNSTGKVAAVGLTIPEPATILLLGVGGLALLRKSGT